MVKCTVSGPEVVMSSLSSNGTSSSVVPEGSNTTLALRSAFVGQEAPVDV